MIVVQEDFLCDMMERKLQEIKANVNYLDSLLHTTPDKIGKLKKFISTIPVKVIKGYPRTPSELPCLCLVLSGEEESEEGLGDSFYDEEEDENLLYTQFEANYKIEVWANNADLVTHLYHLAKWMFMSSRDELVKNLGLYRQRLSGADFQPAPNYFPEFVYRRGMTFWCQFTMSIPSEEIVPNISDIHVNETIVGDEGL